MKIAIIGSGAIGLFYGAELQRSGEDVHFLFRSDFEAAKERGITVKKGDSSYQLDSVKAHVGTEDIGECDLVIVSLKTTSNSVLADLLHPLVGPRTILLTLQNGLGNDTLLHSEFPTNPILAGLCFVCLNRTAPAVVENFLPGSVSIGPFKRQWIAEGRAVAEIFQKATVVTRFEENLQLVQWKKLVWNIPFNGLTIALGGVSTDVIVQSEAMAMEARSLMKEVIDGAAALGLEIDESFIDLQITRTVPMGAYKPSSMIDFKNGREGEVEGIWGEPLRQALSAGAKMPKLEMLYSLLKVLCK